MILFEDAPLDEIIPQAAWTIFANHGQNCCAGSRLYVHASLYDRAIDGVAAIVEGIVMRSPLDPASQMGPLFSRAHRDRVLGFVADGTAAGARLAAGGAGRGKAYVAPTVLAGVRPDMRPVREEIFGPVLVAAPFEDEADVLALANASDFGLGASVWTNDLARVHRMTRALEAGTVWVNCHNVLDVALPFGGWKSAGIGADLGEAAVLACTRVKAAVHRYAWQDGHNRDCPAPQEQHCRKSLRPEMTWHLLALRHCTRPTRIPAERGIWSRGCSATTAWPRPPTRTRRGITWAPWWHHMP